MPLHSIFPTRAMQYVPQNIYTSLLCLFSGGYIISFSQAHVSTYNRKSCFNGKLVILIHFADVGEILLMELRLMGFKATFQIENNMLRSQ